MPIQQESNMGLLDFRSWAELWRFDRVDIDCVVHADFVPIYQASGVNTRTQKSS
jgi:hypothetical protein